MFGKARRISLKVKIVAALGVILVLVVPSLYHQREEARKQAQQKIEMENEEIRSFNEYINSQGLDSMEQEFGSIIRKKLYEINKEERAIFDRGTPVKGSRSVILQQQDQQRLDQIRLEKGKLEPEMQQIYLGDPQAKPGEKVESRPLGRAIAYWQSQINEQERDIANKQKTMERMLSALYELVAQLGESSTPEDAAQYRRSIEERCRWLEEDKLRQKAAAPVLPIPKDRRDIFDKIAELLDKILSEITSV